MIVFRLLSRIGRITALPTIIGGHSQVAASGGGRGTASWLATAGLLALGGSSCSSTALTSCQDGDHQIVEKEEQGTNSTVDLSSISATTTVIDNPFDESVLTYDHYNGVTLDLEKFMNINGSSKLDSESFSKQLEQALLLWRVEGRKGVWIHATTEQSHLVHCCVELGFSFHFVKNKKLILSQWLPDDVDSKLPLGPTHQVGVGTVVFHPKDPSMMLVVQERTGPAAALGLWKMPTGLLDPEEDIPDAAARELKEETGLDGTMEGIVCFRQAHSPSRSSDLFFVCRMCLKDPDNASNWHPQEDEIADIRWMKVEEYCNQNRWQGSPVYESLNDSILKASLVAQEKAGFRNNLSGMIIHQQLPLGFGRGTNALFKSQL